MQTKTKPGFSPRKFLLLFFGLLPVWFFIAQCNDVDSRSAADPRQRDYTIRLRWVKSYSGETWKDVKTGLYWSLSYLGAALDPQKEDQLLRREDSTVFVLDLQHAGYSPGALEAFSVILDSIKASEEYKTEKKLDLGRFLVLTEHSSWHYYAITGVPKTLAEFQKLHHIYDAHKFRLEKSGVANHGRVIHFVYGTTITEMGFIAEEKDGPPDENVEVDAYEVFDIMPNGQLRFAIYGKDGKLIDGSPVASGKAGKPSKCIWCHELSVQPLYFETPEHGGGLTIGEFGQCIDSCQHVLDRYRTTLKTLIHFGNKQDHTYGELLYIGFMEPSSYRLAQDMGLPESAVKDEIEGLPAHPYPEFPFLGMCYHRRAIDSLSWWDHCIPVPYSVREPEGNEPDYFHSRK